MQAKERKAMLKTKLKLMSIPAECLRVLLRREIFLLNRSRRRNRTVRKKTRKAMNQLDRSSNMTVKCMLTKLVGFSLILFRTCTHRTALQINIRPIAYDTARITNSKTFQNALKYFFALFFYFLHFFDRVEDDKG